MASNTYLDFAENDYNFFTECYNHGMVADHMGEIAQGICEKYMKHTISEHYSPQSNKQQKELDSVLWTHSLNRLMKFMKKEMEIEFSADAKNEMRILDGFYISSHYPKEDILELDENDMAHCQEAVELCREKILSLEREFSQEREGMVEDDMEYER